MKTNVKLKQEVFGSSGQSNFARIIEYASKLQEKAKPYQNYGKPYFKGEPRMDFYEYLEDKKLNETPLELDKAFEDIAFLTQNMPNWANPGTMINVIPPVNLASFVASCYAQSFNSNFAQDTYAGFFILAELEVVKYISDLVGWDWTKSIGLFTFGGKGTNLYATKIALSKCDPMSSTRGCEPSKYFMLTSANAHPCHYEVCDWLGIGKDACIEIPCLEDGTIDLGKTENIICEELEKGKLFLGCNLNGGSTNELYVDPIRNIHNLISEIVDRYHLNYRPHIHVDSVIGWIYLFFKKYDFKTNPLGISGSSLKKIRKLSRLASDFKYADSMGIDFHKTGFCPYVSSLFICKERKDYFALNPDKYQSIKDLRYGNHNPYQTSLELTRSSAGAVAALTSLKSLGINGFQQVYAEMFEASELFRKKLSENRNVCILNQDSCWLATLFILKPKKYASLKFDEILQLGEAEIAEIKAYNVKFAELIQTKAHNSECSFVFTSSRSHLVPGTSISLGTLKAYPMSVFFNEDTATRIVQELEKEIEAFDGGVIDSSKSSTGIISDDMVYRKGRS